MGKKILHLILYVLLLQNGCGKNIYEKISDQIINKCQSEKDECIISMEEITNFEWDKMYVFKEEATLEEIEEALGFKYKYFDDVARRIVFVADNKVTYHEDEFPYPSKEPAGKVFFQFKDDAKPYMLFHRKKANFKIRKKKINGDLYFYLIPK